MAEPSLLQRRLAEKRAKEEAEAAAAAAATPVTPQFDADLIPDAGWERSDEDREIDEVIQRIDIIMAYIKWCGKMHPDVRPGQTEGIMISCPKPEHRDANPSAWINMSKQTWFCGGCEEGGDIYDIAAYNLGYSVPGYKDGAEFHRLRKQMVEDFGYRFVSAPGLSTPMIVAPEPPAGNPVEAPPAPAATAPAPEPPPRTDAGTVSPLTLAVPGILEDGEEYEDIVAFPTLDWRSIVQPDTFLDVYMRCTQIDDIPEEYNFWNALVAIGEAIGPDCALFDRVPVKGNLFVCVLGNTGDGKSRSFGHFKKLISAALPYDHTDPTSKGCRIVSGAASGEVVISSFSKPIEDPSNPKKVIGFAPVRGIIEFNELSALTGRSDRLGNILKPIMMQFYDGDPVISSTSLTSGVKEAHNAFGSAITSSQPRALRQLVSQGDADSGFLNRWVFASGGAKERIAIGGEQIDVSPAIAPLQEIRAWCGFGKMLQWSNEAADLFTQFFHKTIQPAKQRDQTGLLTRMDLLMKKLILLFAANAKEDVVSRRSVECAIAMYDYLIQTYLIPAQAIGDTVAEQCKRDIIEFITKQTEKDKPPSAAEILRALAAKKYAADLIHKTLKILGEMQVIHATPTPDGGRGRKTVRYSA